MKDLPRITWYGPDDERYKAIVRESGVYALASSDGLGWLRMQDDPILTDGPFDSHNIAFYDIYDI